MKYSSLTHLKSQPVAVETNFSDTDLDHSHSGAWSCLSACAVSGPDLIINQSSC